MGMSEDDKRNCCLLEIQETEAKYYRTLEDIEKVGAALPLLVLPVPGARLSPGTPCLLLLTQAAGSGWPVSSWAVSLAPRPTSQPSDLSLARDCPELGRSFLPELGVVMASAPDCTGLSSCCILCPAGWVLG